MGYFVDRKSTYWKFKKQSTLIYLLFLILLWVYEAGRKALSSKLLSI